MAHELSVASTQAGVGARLTAQGTVETKFAEMPNRKQPLMDSVFDPDAGKSMNLSEQEILSLFASIEQMH